MTIRPIDAEICAIGSVLIDDACLPELTGVLDGSDFMSAVNQTLYQAILALDKAGEPIDPISVMDRCAKDGTPVERGYLMDAMDLTATAKNAGMYARLVRENSIRRSLAGLAEEMEERSSAGGDPRGIIGDMMRELEQLEEKERTNELATSGDMMLSFLDHRRKVDAGGGAYAPTGYGELDRKLGGGLLNSGLYILAARPGMGKTTFALCIADNVAESCGPVLFVSLEMDMPQIAAKRLARLTGLSSTRLLMGTLNDGEYEKVAAGSVALETRPMQINRKPSATVADIGHMARQVKGLRLVVVDYLGLIRPAEKGSRYETTTQISNDLKALARSLAVPVLALAQLNRANEARTDKRPNMSDLRDSGAVEQDADGILLLHSPAYYTQSAEEHKPWEPIPLEVTLAKNRHGGTGRCDMAAYLETCRIIPAKRERVSLCD